MWNYYLVEELIMNDEWIKTNGDNWAAGRVECFNDEESFGYADREYWLMIDRKDWIKFDNFLRSFTSDSLHSLESLIEYSKLPIVIFKNEY